MLSEKIVVIDSNPKSVNMVKMALEEHEIIDFTSTEEALSFLKKPHEISLVLLDVREHWSDDISTLEEIKKNHKNLTVIVVTAYASKDIIVEALRCGADDLLEKPLVIDELRERVNVLLKDRDYFNKDAGTKANHIERIKRFVERNHQSASLKSVAHIINRSPKYVSRMFNEECQSSFRDFKLKVKMDIAKSLLKDSSINITELSLNLGYKNPESFMRVFKRMTNLTPTEYREKARSQSE